jgi:hypothetical protein
MSKIAFRILFESLKHDHVALLFHVAQKLMTQCI